MSAICPSTRTIGIRLGQGKQSAQIKPQHSNAVMDKMFRFAAFGPSWLIPQQGTGTVVIS